MRKLLCLLLALAVVCLVGCGARAVACDRCGKEITVGKNSNVTDEWILYCKACETELFGQDGLVPAE